ncbi:MAG TPA: flagellar hook-length control protein FliK [Candidatus Aquilonibacter sp.]|nr:flagellar hook-length control protein FliK [Candidatus Aquilonibacter sp.]
MGNGAAFANILATLAPGASPANGSQSDLLSQLAALIQNGTPLTKIVDQISKSVNAALQKQLAGQLPQSDLDQLSSSLTQSIANALAPPGNGPPGTPEQQASALAARLRRLIESLARETTDNVGQLNDIAGHLLDASPAKETPAQTRGIQTASTLDVSSLVSSILANALGSLQTLRANPLQGTLGSTQRVVTGDPLRGPALDRTLRSDPRQGSLDHPVIAFGTPAPSLAPAPGHDPAFAAASDGNASQDASSQPTPITMQNAPDLLARMLVRAAGTDARINGVSALNSGTAPQGPSTPNSGLAARLESLLATISANASTRSSNPSFTGNGSGNSFDEQLAGQQQPVLATHDTSSQTTNVAVPGFSQLTQLQQLAQNPQAAAAHVNATAVIEQLIKGMSMRTNAQGSSEIRLHLQPENLGDVTMKITVTGSQISANVIASSNEVRNALVSNHQQLARSLADAGLTLSGFSVDVSGGNAGRDRQSDDRTAGFGRRYIVHELPGVQTTDTSALASLGPPLLSGSSLALFNYLA